MKELRVAEFSLRDTLECGQTFCWTKLDGGYVTTDVGQVVYVEQDEDILRYATSERDVSLTRLFRLDDPLAEIHGQIDKDELMHQSIAFAPGLRIISDPFFPCLISFICSIRNNIPSIRRVVQRIRERYGPMYEFDGRIFYGMPDPERLAQVPVGELRGIGLDWRAEFIVRTSRAIVNEEVSEAQLRSMPYDTAHSTLKQLHGVGDKVADCVCLFSLGFLEAFPIDVWIERVIQKQYGIFTQSGKSYANKSQAAREYFGPYAGYAQEYLYYYTRSTYCRR
ncbi:MAG: DNA-3-methyladenine glycosylase family protein [Candidatus Thorarchaeota archaeon]